MRHRSTSRSTPGSATRPNAAVIAYVAEKQLGCKVMKKNLNEQVSWQGFGTGEVDAVLENWGHEDLMKKYITEQKVAEDAGPTGNKGIIGWYVPPWLAKAAPGHHRLEEPQQVRRPCSRPRSRAARASCSTATPSFVTNDAALVKNLKLNYKVVYAGSEAALIQAFRQAEQNKKPVIGYFYEPQWFMSEVPLVKVNLPPYKDGLRRRRRQGRLRLPAVRPQQDRQHEVRRLAAARPTTLVKNFNWTNDDQNLVAKYIAEDKMSAEAAAKKWVEANPDKVKAWLS